MPHYKPDRVLSKGAFYEPGKPLPYRDPSNVDRILGPRIKRRVDHHQLSSYPLAQTYPTWDMYHEALATERAEASREGRKPHPAAAVPQQLIPAGHELGPPGPSAAQIRRRHPDIKY